MYEGGIRVPMIIKWPHVIHENSVNKQYIIAEDLFPSILEMAGITNARTIQKVDGKSFVPFLKDEKIKDTQRILVWHYPNKWIASDGPGINYKSAIRKGNWKLVYDLRTAKKELYNLSTDIGEHNDLANAFPMIAKQLTIELKKYLERNNAPMPTFKNGGSVVITNN